MTGVIIALTLLLAVMGTGYYAYQRVRKKVREFSHIAFGTEDIMQGLRSAELESETTPKSVSGATSIYLPRIMRDFPDFHYDEMKRRAENVLTSFLRSVDRADPALLAEGTEELKTKLKMRIEMLRDAGEEEHFDNIRIHRTEIRTYRREKGRCSIVFQSAVQYERPREQGGRTPEGTGVGLHQTRYDVEVIYIQDREIAENTADAGLAANCPNCGAPLPELGAKICPYCDSPLVEFNIRTWNFSDVSEVN